MFNIVNLFGANTSTIFIWIIIGVLLVLMFVMPMFTNRKRQKEVNEMFDSISIGDEVMTVGGVMGKVVALESHESGEKLMVIETGEGNNKTTMTFTVQALRLNYTKNKLRQEQLAKQKAEREAEKARKNGVALPLEEVKKDEENPVEDTSDAQAVSAEGEPSEAKEEETVASVEAVEEPQDENSQK